MSDSLAALFFSHLTLILIWLAWILLFRGLRIDFLRFRLRSLRIELDRLPRSDEHSRLWNRTLRLMQSVEYLTLTRFLCCLLLGRVLSSQDPPEPATTDARLVLLGERVLTLTADHVTAGLPIISPILKKHPNWLDLILETCPNPPPKEASMHRV